MAEIVAGRVADEGAEPAGDAVEIGGDVLAIAGMIGAASLALGAGERGDVEHLDVEAPWNPANFSGLIGQVIDGGGRATALTKLADAAIELGRIEQRTIGGHAHDHVLGPGRERLESASVAGEHVVDGAAVDRERKRLRGEDQLVVAGIERRCDHAIGGRLGSREPTAEMLEQAVLPRAAQDLAGQPRRAHTGLDDDDDPGHWRARPRARTARNASTTRSTSVSSMAGYIGRLKVRS